MLILRSIFAFTFRWTARFVALLMAIALVVTVIGLAYYFTPAKGSFEIIHNGKVLDKHEFSLVGSASTSVRTQDINGEFAEFKIRKSGPFILEIKGGVSKKIQGSYRMVKIHDLFFAHATSQEDDIRELCNKGKPCSSSWTARIISSNPSAVMTFLDGNPVFNYIESI